MLIRCHDISKSYFVGNIEVKALRNISFGIHAGSFTSIVGPSGSGKSTLMNIIGCLDSPTSGNYYLDSEEVSLLSHKQLASIRNKKIGFIFQSFNLLPRYNVFHNVELPLIYSGLSKKERRQRVHEAIDMVGLAERMKHRPSELSGGQKQRVAIARALVNQPALILADEPTGNLDSATGAEIMDVFRHLISTGRTIVVVTHDMNVAANTERVITIVDGTIRENSDTDRTACINEGDTVSESEAV